MANGNRIKIRHGTGTPTTDNLLSYELGWNGEALFINNNGLIKKLFGDSQSFTDLSVTGSASFTNIPTAPTALSGTSDAQLATTAFVAAAINGYLPLSGGILSGNLYIEKNSAWAGFKATRTDSGLSVSCEVGTDGIKHGIYSNGYYNGTNFYSDAKWIIYRDSNGEIQIPSGLKELKLYGHTTTVGTVLKASLSAQKAISSKVITNITSLELPSGIWVVTGRIRFSANGTGYRRAGFGTTNSEDAIQVQTPAVTGAVTQLTLTKIIEVSSNTTYYLNAYQNSGSSLNLPAGNNGEINGITAICIA